MLRMPGGGIFRNGIKMSRADKTTRFRHTSGMDMSVARRVSIVILVFLVAAAALTPFAAADACRAEARAEGFEYFDELMGEYSTSYASSSAARKHNIELAASAVNGAVIGAGEEFSFNVTVGVRSKRRGYLPAPVIVSGKYTTGVGGGVCQVSTTLYNAVLLWGIGVANVSRHSIPVSYVPRSMDAMVSGATDFRFKNNTPYPVRIEMNANGSSLTAALYGFPIYTDGLSVEFEGRVVKKISCSEYTRREAAEGELNEGETERVISAPKDGMYTEAVRILYYRGEKVEETSFRRDYYPPVKGIMIYRAPDPPSPDPAPEQ